MSEGLFRLVGMGIFVTSGTVLLICGHTTAGPWMLFVGFMAAVTYRED